MLATTARACSSRLAHPVHRLCTAAESPVHRLPQHHLQHLFSHLAPLVVRANAEHARLLSLSNTTSSHHHTRLACLTPIAHLTQALNRLHHHHTDALHILRETDPRSDPLMYQLARDEIQTLLAQKHQTAVQIISHLLHMHTHQQQQQQQQPHQHAYSDNSAIVEIRAGTGGHEAALFVADLHAMYLKFALRRKWKARVLSHSPTTLGGLRELILRLSGVAVYDALRVEAGVHRVQRVPATETAGRVHTSTASVAVLRDAAGAGSGAGARAARAALRDADVKIDVFRASGAGGQHVNKTESAVRATHMPTGLVATSQEERSQHRNKALALEALALRLAARRAAEQAARTLSERRAQLGGSGGGERSERIRTYNFPQRRVTDHRIAAAGALARVLGAAATRAVVGEKSVGLDGVLQGAVELELLMDGVRRAQQLEQLQWLVEEAGQLRCAQSDELGQLVGGGTEAA